MEGAQIQIWRKPQGTRKVAILGTGISGTLPVPYFGLSVDKTQSSPFLDLGLALRTLSRFSDREGGGVCLPDLRDPEAAVRLRLNATGAPGWPGEACDEGPRVLGALSLRPRSTSVVPGSSIRQEAKLPAVPLLCGAFTVGGGSGY